MLKKKHLHSAGGVLIKDGQVLLIHWDEPRNSYDFPKGGIKWFESPEKACIREVFEETGYKVKVVQFIDSTEYEYDWPNNIHFDKKVEYYLLELIDETAYPPQREKYETFENAWVPIDKAEAVITRDINKDIFKKAVALSNK